MRETTMANTRFTLFLIFLAVTIRYASGQSSASSSADDRSDSRRLPIATRVRRGQNGHHGNKYTDKGGSIEVVTHEMVEVTTAAPSISPDVVEDLLDQSGDLNVTYNTTGIEEEYANISYVLNNIFAFNDLFNFTDSTNDTLEDIYNMTSYFDADSDIVLVLNISRSLGIENIAQLKNITSQLNISRFEDLYDFVDDNNITNVEQLWNISQNTSLFTNTTTVDVGLSTIDMSPSPTPVTEAITTLPSTTDEPSRMETVTNDDSWTSSTTPLAPSTSPQTPDSPDNDTKENRTEIDLIPWSSKPGFGGLVAALVVGCLFVVILIVLFTKRVYEMYQRRDYQKMDYLINGIYN